MIKRLIACLLIAALALPTIACTGNRTSGSLDRGLMVNAHTVDNGTGAAVTVADIRFRAINPQTGERDGPWEQSIQYTPGANIGHAALAAVTGVAIAGITGGASIVAAGRLNCGGRGCGSGTTINVEGAVAVADANARGTATTTTSTGVTIGH